NRRPPLSPLFPYTTLFRSSADVPRRVSATEAKVRLGALMQWTVDTQDEVIVETNGAPKVVIVPYERYGELEALRQFKRRQEAFEDRKSTRLNSSHVKISYA